MIRFSHFILEYQHFFVLFREGGKEGKGQCVRAFVKILSTVISSDLCIQGFKSNQLCSPVIDKTSTSKSGKGSVSHHLLGGPLDKWDQF